MDSSDDERRVLEALLIEALLQRHLLQRATTLRDLHDLIDVPQPLALQLARQLEVSGKVVIEASKTDAFASQVRLSDTILEQLMNAREGWLQRGPDSDG